MLYGHFRRYDRQDILALLKGSGLEPLEVWCSGAPFIAVMENIVGFLGNPFFRKRGKQAGDMRRSTDKSGITSPIREKMGFTDFLFNRFFYIPFLSRMLFGVMDLFLKSNAGSTWFVICRKKSSLQT
jgi:hypothetical protein